MGLLISSFLEKETYFWPFDLDITKLFCLNAQSHGKETMELRHVLSAMEYTVGNFHRFSDIGDIVPQK